MADLVKVRYVGPHTEGVWVNGVFCASGETVEVPRTTAEGLAGQEVWEVAHKRGKESEQGA